MDAARRHHEPDTPRPAAGRPGVPAGRTPEQAVLALQRGAGNAAVQRLLAPPPGPRAPATGFATPGVPLAGDVRSRMETALGGDFAGVHVHADDDGARQADALGASAFTVGRDVAFAAGTYQPGTVLGDALLAHELAHVARAGRPPDRPVLAARRPPRDGDTPAEDDANRAATQAVLALHAGPTEVARPSGLLARVRTGLRLHRCTPTLGKAVGKARPKQVTWKGGQPMVASHGDTKVNPTWQPGAADHAVSYTKGAIPTVDAQFDVGEFNTPPAGTTLSVRVTEGGAPRGAVVGITPAATVNIAGLPLAGLTGSAEVRSAQHTLQWEASVDGKTWTPVCTTGVHPVYWTHAAPRITPAPNLAVANATRYAGGATAPADIANRIRSGPRSVDGLAYNPKDPIDDDPLDVYTNKVGICTDYANLVSVLARAVGLDAVATMYWGGFDHLGRPVWISLKGSLQTLKKVQPGKPAFGMPGNPAGWDFIYHAVGRVQGTLQDAALDRVGYDAEAVHQGLVVRLVELAGGALPGATRGTPFRSAVPRKDNTVAVTVRDYGPLITDADFTPIVPLSIPAGTRSPVDATGVAYALSAGTLPRGSPSTRRRGSSAGPHRRSRPRRPTRSP